jgi:uncharacterized protein YbjT (DUF2867 family)
VPPLLVQPVAASDVGQVLAEIATGTPRNRTRELAGPETQDLVDMARRTLTARGQSVRLVPSWRGGLFSVEMAGEVLRPDQTRDSLRPPSTPGLPPKPLSQFGFTGNDDDC